MRDTEERDTRDYSRKKGADSYRWAELERLMKTAPKWEREKGVKAQKAFLMFLHRLGVGGIITTMPVRASSLGGTVDDGEQGGKANGSFSSSGADQFKEEDEEPSSSRGGSTERESEKEEAKKRRMKVEDNSDARKPKVEEVWAGDGDEMPTNPSKMEGFSLLNRLEQTKHMGEYQSNLEVWLGDQRDLWDTRAKPTLRSFKVAAGPGGEETFLSPTEARLLGHEWKFVLKSDPSREEPRSMAEARPRVWNLLRATLDGTWMEDIFVSCEVDQDVGGVYRALMARIQMTSSSGYSLMKATWEQRDWTGYKSLAEMVKIMKEDGAELGDAAGRVGRPWVLSDAEIRDKGIGLLYAHWPSTRWGELEERLSRMHKANPHYSTSDLQQEMEDAYYQHRLHDAYQMKARAAEDPRLKPKEVLATHIAQVGAGGASKTEDRVCWRFNSPGGCTRGGCEFQHRVDKNVKVCKQCAKTGHTSDQCWKEVTCGRCGKKGHPMEKCYKPTPDKKPEVNLLRFKMPSTEEVVTNAEEEVVIDSEGFQTKGGERGFQVGEGGIIMMDPSPRAPVSGLAMIRPRPEARTSRGERSVYTEDDGTIMVSPRCWPPVSRLAIIRPQVKEATKDEGIPPKIGSGPLGCSEKASKREIEDVEEVVQDWKITEEVCHSGQAHVRLPDCGEATWQAAAQVGAHQSSGEPTNRYPNQNTPLPEGALERAEASKERVHRLEATVGCQGNYVQVNHYLGGKGDDFLAGARNRCAVLNFPQERREGRGSEDPMFPEAGFFLSWKKRGVQAYVEPDTEGKMGGFCELSEGSGQGHLKIAGAALSEGESRVQIFVHKSVLFLWGTQVGGPAVDVLDFADTAKRLEDHQKCALWKVMLDTGFTEGQLEGTGIFGVYGPLGKENSGPRAKKKKDLIPKGAEHVQGSRGLRPLHLLVAPMAVGGLRGSEPMDALEHARATRAHREFGADLHAWMEEVGRGAYSSSELGILAAFTEKGITALATLPDPHSSKALLNRTEVWEKYRAVLGQLGKCSPDTPGTRIHQESADRLDCLCKSAERRLRRDRVVVRTVSWMKDDLGMKALRLVAPLGLGSKVVMDALEHKEATRVHFGFAASLQEFMEEIDKATCVELECLAAAIDKGIAALATFPDPPTCDGRALSDRTEVWEKYLASLKQLEECATRSMVVPRDHARDQTSTVRYECLCISAKRRFWKGEKRANEQHFKRESCTPVGVKRMEGDGSPSGNDG